MESSLLHLLSETVEIRICCLSCGCASGEARVLRVCSARWCSGQEEGGSDRGEELHDLCSSSNIWITKSKREMGRVRSARGKGEMLINF